MDGQPRLILTTIHGRPGHKAQKLKQCSIENGHPLLPTMSISFHSSFLPSTNILAVKILPSATTGVRRPFHLALLLDKSGSMAGTRIQAVKRTLHLLIDAMADDDVLSIVSYSHDSQIDANGVVLSDTTRPALHITVDDMSADGGTNMESAFMALYAIAKDPPIDAAFIMTDGQINQGITAGTGLQRILTSVLVPGTPINTLGFGADHNSRLLRDMALRSRGSYTYADADEMLPAIIGNIMGGLASEAGRNAVLTIPDGWRCLELGSEIGDTQYVVGTLIAEKDQWVVLEGPASVETTLAFQWTVGSDIQFAIHTPGNAIPAIPTPIIAEQLDRVHVASTFSHVTDLIEANDINRVKRILIDLGKYLDESVAKNRPFVIRLHAQVDEMLEAITRPAYNSPLIGRFLQASPLVPPLALPLALPLAPMMSRMASNISALGGQRGFFTTISSDSGDVDDTFSSPNQSRITRDMTMGYTQENPVCP